MKLNLELIAVPKLWLRDSSWLGVCSKYGLLDRPITKQLFSNFHV